MEQYKTITEYPNYEISSYGNVRNSKTGKILSLCSDTGGYLKVSLYGPHDKKSFKVHRLVAIHFVDNPDNKPTVDHIDNDRTNNNAINLRWATSQEQARNTGLSKANTSGVKGVYYIDFFNYLRRNKFTMVIIQSELNNYSHEIYFMYLRSR
jgi:hypothetical protein